jgi:hypothetical protein
MLVLQTAVARLSTQMKAEAEAKSQAGLCPKTVGLFWTTTPVHALVETAIIVNFPKLQISTKIGSEKENGELERYSTASSSNIPCNRTTECATEQSACANQFVRPVRTSYALFTTPVRIHELRLEISRRNVLEKRRKAGDYSNFHVRAVFAATHLHELLSHRSSR